MVRTTDTRARRTPPRAGALLLATLLTGCAGYRPGPTAGFEAGARSLEIAPFTNQTMEPRLPESLVVNLRTAVQKDGTYRLSTHTGEADVVVRGTLLRLDRQGVTFSARDAQTVRDFQLTLVARVVAVDRSSGRTLVDREVQGRAVVPVLNDQVSSERQTLPLLTEDLSRNILILLTDGDW
ncbi:MAG: hypothetical protein H7A46_06905 [Verrucomicrobiales bacterium]|nr:hypothetical protein [Verrucomicrobiales bacterium]